MTNRQFQITRYVVIAVMAIVFFVSGGLPDEAPVVTAIFLAYGAVSLTLEILFAAARAIRDNEIQQDTYEDIFIAVPDEGELASGSVSVGDEI